MSIIYENSNYMSLSEYCTGQQNGRVGRNRLSFAHKIDENTIRILESVHVTNTFNRIVETIVSEQFGTLLATAITVDPRSFPCVYKLLEDCCRDLNIPIPHTVISNDIQGINAMATGTDDFAFIILGNFNLKLLTLEENKFIIGHECGHIAMGHVVYHSMGQFVGQLGSYIPLIGEALAGMVTLPLNTWMRSSEITADRAGLLCCKDLRTAQRALLKIVGGFTDTSHVDIDEYIRQSKEYLDVHYVGTYHEFFMTHPLIPKRLEALDLFAHSQMYYRESGLRAINEESLLTDEQLEERVNKVLSILK